MKAVAAWCLKALATLIVPMGFFLIGDALFKSTFPEPVTWKLKDGFATDPSFNSHWMAFVLLTISQTVIGASAAFYVVWRLRNLLWPQLTFLLVFLVFCTLMIGRVTHSSNGENASLYLLLGSGLFEDVLSPHKINGYLENLGENSFLVFKSAYGWFSLTAAIMSTIIIAGFTLSIPLSHSRIKKEEIADYIEKLRHILNISSIILTIGVLQLFIWMRLPAFAIDQEVAGAYSEMMRTSVIYYAAIYTLVVVSGASMAYAMLCLSARRNSPNWKDLLPSEMRQWELATRISLPLLTATLLGLLENVFE